MLKLPRGQEGRCTGEEINEGDRWGICPLSIAQAAEGLRVAAAWGAYGQVGGLCEAARVGRVKLDEKRRNE